MSGYSLYVAWERMIKEKGVSEKLGIGHTSLYMFRTQMKKGRYPSENAMRMHLRKAGWRMVQTENWDKDAA